MDNPDGFPSDPFAPLAADTISPGIEPNSAAGTREEIWEPVLPAPVPPPEAGAIRHSRYGIASHRWLYPDEAGRPLFMVVRFAVVQADGTERKVTLPYTYGHHRRISRSGRHVGEWQDRTGWHFKRPPPPLAIYGLDRLTARPSAPVLVCEGEKAADAAALLFPDVVAITSQGGSKAAGKTNWTHLAERHVTVWPDHDKAGAKYAIDVAACASKAGAASVRLVTIPDDWPKAWDLADPVPDGVAPGALAALLAEAAVACSPAELPGGLTLGPNGLWFHPTPTEKNRDPSAIFVAAPFEVVGEARDGSGGGWSLLLRWRDRDGVQHQWLVPKRLVHERGNTIAAELEDAGLACGVGARAQILLKQFISGARSSRRLHLVDRAGWHETGRGYVFMLPTGEALGPGAGSLVLESEQMGDNAAFRVAGTLADWQREIATFAADNDRLAFFLCAAFAGPLLDVVAEPSGGFHLTGQSQSGKSTATFVAGSVWGRGDRGAQVRPWRGTANGLEGVAAETSDMILILDEISQADAREVGDVVYMIANESGKARAARNGKAQKRQTWRSLFLSTGELTLADKMADAGKRAMPGLEVRLVNLPADAGAGLGVFQTLHNTPNAAALADHLRDAARTHYGTAARPYLQQLAHDRASDPDSLRGYLVKQRDGFLAQHVPEGADGQVLSVAKRFALVGAAGELARDYGVLPWPQGEAMRAAGACFETWLAQRGGSGAGEDEQAVACVRAFIELHADSRFILIEAPLEGCDVPAAVCELRNTTVMRAGFRRLVRTAEGEQFEFLILPEVWKNEVCKGRDPIRVAASLARRGLLKIEGDKRYQTKVRIRGYSRPRVYWVIGDILDGSDAELGQPISSRRPTPFPLSPLRPMGPLGPPGP